MKLHMHPISTTSRPVVMAAEEMGLPLELVVVDLAVGEHHGEPFVQLNPSRQVPVLDDDGFVLTESSAIMKYLADKANSPLYPKELQARARVNERMDWFNTNFYREYGYHIVYPQVYDHHKRPSDELQDGTIVWGKEKVAALLGVLDAALLGSNPYVCGSELTLADIFGAQLMSCGELVGLNLDAYPKVRAWIDRMKARPAWKKVNEAHDGFAASLSEKGFVSIT